MNDDDNDNTTSSELGLPVISHFPQKKKMLEMAFCVRLPLICVWYKKKDEKEKVFNILMEKQQQMFVSCAFLAHNVAQPRFLQPSKASVFSLSLSPSLIEQLWFITCFLLYGRCSRCDQKKQKNK